MENIKVLLVGAVILSGCATVGDPVMIGPDTYTIVGNGSTFGARNMHEKFLKGMSEHCQSLARIPLLRKDKFESQSHNALAISLMMAQ